MGKRKLMKILKCVCFRFYGHYDFNFDGVTTNIRLKWLSICFNIDYNNGTMQLYLNGHPLPATQRKPMALPEDADTVACRMGKREHVLLVI